MAASLYAKHILQTRWREAEKYIKKDIAALMIYNKWLDKIGISRNAPHKIIKLSLKKWIGEIEEYFALSDALREHGY